MTITTGLPAAGRGLRRCPPRRPPRSRDKRAKRIALAARDGLACAYCRCPFTDPQQATLDHVVPQCLFRTWEQRHLVLACARCNAVKADRLPVLVALLVLGCTAPPVDTTWTLPVLRMLLPHLPGPAHRSTREATNPPLRMAA